MGDNFLNFWFRFIYPNRGYIESGEREHVERCLSGFNSHVGRVFEEVAAEALLELRSRKLVPDFQKIGKWWGTYRDERGDRKTAEIDIVALNDQTGDVLFAECKWEEAVDALRVLQELKEKAKRVEWRVNARTEHYAIFAKSFKERVRGEKFLFDLKDLERLWRAGP
ncbi:MAG: DUF234 domain-containing protein [Candidatus Hadarchaeales archaeon]